MWSLNHQVQWPVLSYFLLDLSAESDLPEVLIFGLYQLLFLVLFLNFSPSSVSLPVPLCADVAQSSALYCSPFIVPMSWPMTAIFIASVITNTYFSSLWSLWWTSNPHYHSSSAKTLFFFMILYHLGRFDSLLTLMGILSLFLP